MPIVPVQHSNGPCPCPPSRFCALAVSGRADFAAMTSATERADRIGPALSTCGRIHVRAILPNPHARTCRQSCRYGSFQCTRQLADTPIPISGSTELQPRVAHSRLRDLIPRVGISRHDHDPVGSKVLSPAVQSPLETYLREINETALLTRRRRGEGAGLPH